MQEDGMMEEWSEDDLLDEEGMGETVQVQMLRLASLVRHRSSFRPGKLTRLTAEFHLQ